jgi:hypothetical protein
MRRAALALLLALAAGCSKQPELNYRHCLKLRVGMTRDELTKVMGAPEETIPFVEGKSLDYLKGRTAYEWSNPATMPGGDHVSVDETTGKVASIRCSNAEITTSVFIEPPAPSTATAKPGLAAPVVAVSTVPAAPAPGLDAAIAAYRKKDFMTAMRIAGPLAQNGDADAQLLAGLIFLNGAAPGQEKNSQPVAMMWFYKSSRQKNAEAQAIYADQLSTGGAPSSTVVTEIQAAGATDSAAGKRLDAELYLNGAYADIVPKDPEEGEKRMLEAARGGDPKAAFELAQFENRKPDLVEAYFWAFVAARHPVTDMFADPVHSLTSYWPADQKAAADKLMRGIPKYLSPAELKTATDRATAVTNGAPPR